jgi:hypothetical protein
LLGGSVPVIRKDAAYTTIIEVYEVSGRGTDTSESNAVVDVSFWAAAKAYFRFIDDHSALYKKEKEIDEQ